MNTLVIVLIAAVCLFGAYMLYGRWLANKWGIDPSAKTPAVVHEDGRDYVPTDGWTVFAHQFSSIAGAGPVTGAIQAAAFGWLPVLLWVLIGGIFFGAVHDFGSLFASMSLDTVTLADALTLMSLPRVVGTAADGVEIVGLRRIAFLVGCLDAAFGHARIGIAYTQFRRHEDLGAVPCRFDGSRRTGAATADDHFA